MRPDRMSRIRSLDKNTQQRCRIGLVLCGMVFSRRGARLRPSDMAALRADQGRRRWFARDADWVVGLVANWRPLRRQPTANAAAPLSVMPPPRTFLEGRPRRGAKTSVNLDYWR